MTAQIGQEAAWPAALFLMAGDLLLLPEIGVEIPVAALYEGVDPDAHDALTLKDTPRS